MPNSALHSILVFIYSAVRLTVTQNTIVTLHTEYSMPNSAPHTSAHYVLCPLIHNLPVLI